MYCSKPFTLVYIKYTYASFFIYILIHMMANYIDRQLQFSMVKRLLITVLRINKIWTHVAHKSRFCKQLHLVPIDPCNNSINFKQTTSKLPLKLKKVTKIETRYLKYNHLPIQTFTHVINHIGLHQGTYTSKSLQDQVAILLTISKIKDIQEMWDSMIPWY